MALRITPVPGNASQASLEGEQATSYRGPRQEFSQLVLVGSVGQLYQLTVEADLSRVQPDLPVVATNVTVSVTRCEAMEAYDEVLNRCVCAAGTERDVATGGCKCADGFHLFTEVVALAPGSGQAALPRCRPCPKDAVCSGGLMAPAEFYWHSSPESEDLRLCPNPLACTSSGAAGAGAVYTSTAERARNLISLQHRLLSDAVRRAASAGGKEGSPAQMSATQLIMAGEYDSDVYTKALCAEGYTGAMCSECAPGFGRARSSECLACPARPSTTLTWYGLVLLYNAACVYLAVRANLRTSQRSYRSAVPVLMAPVIKARSRASRSMFFAPPLNGVRMTSPGYASGGAVLSTR